MPKANHKPKGRFFRFVGIYPLVICGIDTANRECFWRKMKKGDFWGGRTSPTYRTPTC